MSTSNALGFFLFGLAMIFLPAMAPALFEARALDGSSTSELWLLLMGLFQGAMGVAYLIRNEAVPFAVRLMTLRLPVFKPAERLAPGMLLRPLRDGYMAARHNQDQRVAA